MAVAGLATLVLFASALLEGWVPWTALIGLRMVLGGVALLFAATALHRGELAHLGRAVRPLSLAVLPMAWFAVQALPLPFVTNPVWISATGALPTGLWGHITVDVQLTVFSIFSTMAAALMVVAVAAQTIDRARAELALVALCTASILLPVLSQAAIASRVPAGSENVFATLNCLILASLLAMGCGTLAFERYETRHAGRTRARSRLLAVEAGCGAIVIGCLAFAWLIGGTIHLLAAAVGLCVFASIVAARRFGWGAWFVLGTLLILSFAIVAIEANGFWLPPAASGDAQAYIDAEHQMMRDAPWVGTGAGTAPVFSNLYKALDDETVFASSSAATQIQVELGTPALWLLIALLCTLEYVLVRDALRRGRDSVYPILGASVLPTVLVLVFANASLFDWKVIEIGAGTFGLALCQRQSRNTNP